MRLKIPFSLVSFVVVISYGAGLKCYRCTGTITSDCALGNTSSMIITECINKTDTPATIEDFDEIAEDTKFREVCLKFYENNLTPKLCVRGCGIIPINVSDPCEYVEKFLQVKGCKSCTTDLCNTDIEENGAD